jgi:hypothetical protein
MRSFFTTVSVYAICYLLIRIARLSFALPPDSRILFEENWVPNWTAWGKGGLVGCGPGAGLDFPSGRSCSCGFHCCVDKARRRPFSTQFDALFPTKEPNGNAVRNFGSQAAAAPATVSGEPVPNGHWVLPGKAATGGDPRARRPTVDPLAGTIDKASCGAIARFRTALATAGRLPSSLAVALSDRSVRARPLP